MIYTERDAKQDTAFDDVELGTVDRQADNPDERSGDEADGNEGGSKHKLPFMPSDDDDSAFGSTDQHSDA